MSHLSETTVMNLHQRVAQLESTVTDLILLVQRVEERIAGRLSQLDTKVNNLEYSNTPAGRAGQIRTSR